MKNHRLLKITAVAATALIASFCLFGCGTSGSKEVTLQPTVADSALVSSKTLTVGIDSSLAPFGANSNGNIVGVDVDVAAALADQLGLELQVVDVSNENATSLLTSKKVDVVMSSAVVQSSNGSVSVVGPYLENGPVLFGKTGGSNVNLSQLTNSKIGAFKGSIAATTAATYCGTANLVTFDKFQDAFDALENGKVDYVAADLVAGGYLSMSYSDIEYVASLQTPTGVYMGVLSSNTTLSTALTKALDTVNKNGELSVIASKWTGDSCAEHAIPTSSSTVSSTTTSSTTTTDASSATTSTTTTNASGTSG